MTNILEHFRKKLKQQKEDSSNRISQLEACLTTTLASHHAIPAYNNKEKIGMLKNKTEILKEENNKLKHTMNERY